MPHHDPYARFEHVDLTLRDALAIDRTVLANERTLLAYLRSAVALALAGFTFVQLFPGDWLAVIGMVAVPVGVLIAVVGVWRWRRVSRSVGGVRERLLPG